MLKLQCESAALAKAINVVKKAIASSNNSPILSGIHLTLKDNKLELVAMDLNFAMKNIIEVKGIAEDDLVIPAAISSELLSKFNNEEITLESGAKELNIISSKGVFNIPLMDKEDYPEFPSFEGEKKLVFPEEKIYALINKTAFACSTDESRPLFTGVLLEKKGSTITFVGTNTHRLAIKTETLENLDNSEYKVIIPARVLKEITANLGKEIPEDVELSIKSRQIMAHFGNVVIISSLIEGNFPDYRRVVPKSFAISTVFKAKEMESAMKRVATFSNDDYSIVRMEIKADKMLLNSGISDIGKAKEDVDCVTKGKEERIAFNSKYILDILKYAGSEQVTMEMNNSLSPACLKPVSEENYLYVVTPVRVVF